MKLSKRLSQVASFVPKGSCVLDVGCDHAYIPIHLVEEAVCPFAIASDIREGPLAAADEHIESRGLSDRIRTVLCDGIPSDYWGIVHGFEEHFRMRDVPVTLITAGMGGMMMRNILTAFDGPAAFDAYIASPQKDAGAFREYIAESGCVIEDEALVYEDGKYYPVILIGRADGLRKLTPFEAKYGPVLLKRRDPILIQYLVKRLSILSGIIGGLPADHGRRAELQREYDMIACYL